MSKYTQQVGGLPRRGWREGLYAMFNYLDYKTVAGVSQLGTKNGSAVTASEAGAHAYRKTTLTLVDHTVALTDVAGQIAYLASKVYDMPAGSILHLGSRADLTIKKSSAGVEDLWDGDFSLGTVAAAGDNDLTSTEANLVPKTATPAAVGVGAAAVTTAKGISTAAPAIFANGMDVYLNVLVDDDDQDVTGTPANLIFNGTIDIFWVPLGSIS